MLDKYLELKNKFIGLQQRLESDIKSLTKVTIQLSFLKSDRDNWVMAREFLIDVAKRTQEDITSHLEDTISMALEIIPSKDPLRLITEYEIKRNQSELYLYLQEGDKERVPLSNILDTEGKSVEEIISFASRLVVWSIQNPRSSPFQGLDEPFATLKKENISEAGKIVKELQESLGLQLIITTHETELVDYADRVFNFIKVNGRTVVEEFK